MTELGEGLSPRLWNILCKNAARALEVGSPSGRTPRIDRLPRQSSRHEEFLLFTTLLRRSDRQNRFAADAKRRWSVDHAGEGLLVAALQRAHSDQRLEREKLGGRVDLFHGQRSR